MESLFDGIIFNPQLNGFRKSEELAEVKVIYKSKRKGIVVITSSRDAYRVLYPLFDKDTIEFKEDFFVLILNRANHALGWISISSGGTAGTVVDPKIILICALLTNGHGIVMCHNHPSGNLKASQEDIKLTKQVNEGAKLFNIKLLDHIILCSSEEYLSFADEGLL